MKFALFLPALLLATPAFAAEPVTGRWITEGGKALVEIAPCGKTLCGKIARVLKPTPGAPQTDAHNPDAKLRNRPILGLPILTGFAAAGAEWKGSVYDPEKGKTYRSVLQRNADGTLNVKGCIAMFCQAQTWKPAR
ncbi:DUF2147 domain-containing protein [Sphingomonas cavernae]|uniref:DUF2147 domain-containing protein n=1 Tax=Sphingomonas cavernae TaxID=2320861 RepID=A0A418WJH1_9SPHN|nr:DUF2147 domain-containing protein [Sphingomonas cavernae]RJF90193.1 DUF2147 domain-containing protein [Sphingomonas cavernae]